jgi:2-oxoglutarate dehydrogenase E1 component
MHLPQAVGKRVAVVSRPASSAPASGSAKAHAAEQAAIVDAVLPRSG